jgi:hypothetical protein
MGVSGGGSKGKRLGLILRKDLFWVSYHDGYWICAACILVRHVISLSITMLHLNIRGTFQTLERARKNLNSKTNIANA